MSQTLDGDGDQSEQGVHTAQAREPDQSAARRRTWPHGLPALRLNRISHRPAAHPHSEAPPDPPQHAPRYLGPLRFLIGLVLLVLAWAGALAVVLLVQAALQPATHQRAIIHAALVILALGGGCWIGLAALACIIAGAFSLLLALTGRDWR
jgi:hypothetical protein